MSERICEEEFFPYRVVRIGEELFVASNRKIFHRDLLPEGWDSGFQGGGNREKLARFSKETVGGVDMALLTRFNGNRFIIEKNSAHYNWPPMENISEYRTRTVELLREKLGDEVEITSR